MTSSPVIGPRDAFAVVPVVDYEPPAQDVPRNAARCRPSSHAPSLRRRRPQPAPPAAPPAGAMSAPMRQAAMFADAALRRVLEVIDRRRPAGQLRPMLAPTLVDSVASAARSLAGHAPAQAAVLRRTRLQPAGHRDPDSAAEVFGCYSRGGRMHAIACRVELVPAGDAPRWQVVALHIG
ncbi:Rv3235 family protein [Mycobacterium sp. Marseille-P9652]|uniref:Rv3235 family protein n=1 Tax=Mycobacterium sp. Marseille-P9652 TaxID=2654950 RepID=UPI0012E8D0A1|nr:Rv3235 family protein [Mycobacterium sp. Marseille-P9652]